MALNANRTLVELAVSHQVGLTRYSTAVVRRVVALLNRNDPELVDELLRRQTGLGNVNALLSRISALNKTSIGLVGEDLGARMEELAGGEAAYQDSAIARVVGPSYARTSPTAAVLRAVVYSQPFQGGLLREWVAGVEAGRMTRLRQAVRTSVALGESSEALAARIRGTAAAGYKNGILDISRRSVATLARTALAHVAASAREAYYQANSDIVSGVQWVSVLDSRTSAPCRRLDGTVYPLGRGPRPPAHLNCRSSTCAVLKSWQEMGLREEDLTFEQIQGLNGLPAPRVTYSDWLALQPAADQDAILGRAKGILFRQGALTLDRFADASGREYTLAQLRAQDALAFDIAGL